MQFLKVMLAKMNATMKSMQQKIDTTQEERRAEKSNERNDGEADRLVP
jgi:hypothetical protein